MREKIREIRRENVNFVCVDEENFAGEMESIVEPALQRVRKSGRLPVKGGELYWECYERQGADMVVISHGFSESLRKYDELAYYLYNAGYQVLVWDQRGHGMSLRENDNAQVVHVKQFDDYVEDMRQIVEQVAKPAVADGRLFLFAHSMGGCVGTLFLERYPKVFQKAVLSAPMLSIDMGKCPLFAAKLLCNVEKLIGRGERKLFIHGEFDPAEPWEVSCTSSKPRHLYYLQQRNEIAGYQTSGASYSWGGASIGAGREVMKEHNLSKIAVPVLVFSAGKENQVKNSVLEKFVNQIKEGQLIQVPESRHEIFRAQNGTLAAYMEEFIAFLKENEQKK